MRAMIVRLDRDRVPHLTSLARAVGDRANSMSAAPRETAYKRVEPAYLRGLDDTVRGGEAPGERREEESDPPRRTIGSPARCSLRRRAKPRGARCAAAANVRATAVACHASAGSASRAGAAGVGGSRPYRRKPHRSAASLGAARPQGAGGGAHAVTPGGATGTLLPAAALPSEGVLARDSRRPI